MPIILDAVGTTPPYNFPAKYGSIANHLSQRELDPHAWSDLANDGGVLTIYPVCTPQATPHTFTLCGLPEQKSAAVPATQPNGAPVPARWFEAAATGSTLSCSPANIEDVATRAVQASLELALDAEIAAALNARAGAVQNLPSLLCAVNAAIDAIAATQGDSKGLITVSPGALAILLYGNFVKDNNGVLEDPLGNQYRTLRAFANPGNLLYAETESYYELWISPLETLPSPLDGVRDANTVTVRKEQAYILTYRLCNVSAFSWDCVGV